MTVRRPVVLVHGGLYEGTDAAYFWGTPGVAAGLRDAGFAVYAPSRPRHPRSWEEERDALVAAVASRTTDPVVMVAGSNGCSAALRAVIDAPGVVAALVLCWPATAGEEAVDADSRATITAAAGGATADRLLAGQTIRGVLDEELESISIPVTLIPTEPEDPAHLHQTVDQLKALLPQVHVMPATPPAPAPHFRHHRSRFLAILVEAITGTTRPGFETFR